MSSYPKVSVMVPVYNSADFVEAALTSVLAQDYPNLEIVVSDDCSIDGTQNVIREIQKKHPDKIVAFYNEKNIGIAKNCNQCLASCTGELVALFAGDDIMLPGKIKRQVQEFQADPEVVMVYHPVEVFQSETNQTIYVTNQRPSENTDNAEEIIARMGIAGGMSLMVKRAAIPHGGYNEALPYASDWLFHIDIAMQGKVRKINSTLCRYRKYGVNNGKRLSSYLHEFERVLDIVEERYGDHPRIVKACRAGRARFWAGEGFRQLQENIALARNLFVRAIKLQPFNVKYYLAYVLATNKPFANAATSLKYFIKRFA